MTIESFWDREHREQSDKIHKQGVKAGGWVNLADEYGDVWHKVTTVWTGTGKSRACSIWDREYRETYMFFWQIRKFSKTLPDDARIVYSIPSESKRS
jgi:hypothetical protein